MRLILIPLIAATTLAALEPARAQTASVQGSSPAPASLLDGAPGSITVAGITVYGVADIAYGYQTHGAPMNGHYTAAQAYIVQRATNREHSGFSPSGLQQSFIGIKGNQPLSGLTGDDALKGWSIVFRGDIGFNPLSGDLSDSPRSLTQQNGVQIKQQTSSGDSSRTGQIFNGDVYAGFRNTQWGELRFGRNSNVMQEELTAFDPQQASVAFSPFGYSGNAGGLGDTENGRHDNSLKYINTFGPLRVGGTIAPWSPTGEGWFGYDFFVGLDGSGALKGFSLDGVYGQKKSAIAAASLSSTDCTTTLHLSLGAGNSTNYVKATISDNTAFAVLAKYKYESMTLLAGFENQYFSNPSDPLTSGGVAGGYVVPVASLYANNAFSTDRIIGISWIGFRQALTPKLTLAGGWYHYEQNAYIANGAPCKNASKGNAQGASTGITSNCGGRENILSATLDYQLTKRLDLYAGLGWSQVEGGLSSGFVKTEATDVLAGARVKF